MNQSDFKTQMKDIFIPALKHMVEKEKEHLLWLEKNKAPKRFVEESKEWLDYYQKRHDEFAEFLSKDA